MPELIAMGLVGALFVVLSVLAIRELGMSSEDKQSPSS